MHLAKDLGVVDYIKMPNMGHIAKGKPQSVIMKTKICTEGLQSIHFHNLWRDFVFQIIKHFMKFGNALKTVDIFLLGFHPFHLFLKSFTL